LIRSIWMLSRNPQCQLAQPIERLSPKVAADPGLRRRFDVRQNSGGRDEEHTATALVLNDLGWVDGRCAHGVIQSMTYGICELSKT
jgi:hypothetical protein